MAILQFDVAGKCQHVIVAIVSEFLKIEMLNNVSQTLPRDIWLYTIRRVGYFIERINAILEEIMMCIEYDRIAQEEADCNAISCDFIGRVSNNSKILC